MKSLKVNVCVHQGSVLRPLLFIIVLEALLFKNNTQTPWDDLFIVTETLQDCVEKLEN